MTKELVIELRIPLSGDMFRDAEVITKAQGVYSQILDLAGPAFGENNYNLSVETPNVRKTREPRADAGVQRGPRAKKNTNGAGEQPPA